MAPKAQIESRYSSLDGSEDVDLENDSDTTLATDRFLPKGGFGQSSRPSRSSRLQTTLTWLRWGTVVALQAVIIVLLVWKPEGENAGWAKDDTETGGDINGLYVPRK